MAEKKQEFVKEITSMDEDFAQWYTDIVLKAELADYAHVVHCPTVPAFCFGTFHSPDETLIC